MRDSVELPYKVTAGGWQQYPARETFSVSSDVLTRKRAMHTHYKHAPQRVG